MKRKLSPVLAIVLVLLMLAACGSSTDSKTEVKQVKVGETISAKSKWINSSIDGAIDANTVVNPKDDFYTAANRDWLLEQHVTEERPAINFSTIPDELMLKRKIEIVKGENSSVGGENPAEMPEAQLKHNEELLVKFGELAGNWDERNAKGIEPLRPYVEAIESISSMQDMTDYMMNKDGTNLCFFLPVTVTVSSTMTNHDTNTVVIDLGDTFTLGKGATAEYTNITNAGKIAMQLNDQVVHLLLEKLGYGNGQIKRILKDCYRFETRLAKAQTLVSGAADIESYVKETDNRHSFQQLQDMQGAFPLTDILAHYGYDVSKSYSVSYPKYLASVGLLYQQRYLDEIKAYYMVHTLSSAMPLLDRQTFDSMKEMEAVAEEVASKPKNDAPDPHTETANPLSEADQEAKLLLDEFITPYLGEPLDQIYVARYCSAEQKAELKALIADIIAYYRTMLMQETWLSMQAREMAVEKLEHITVRAVYPDHFNDYAGLDISSCENLVDAVAAINAFAFSQRVDLIDTPVDRSDWDMKAVPTTVVNAYYMPNDNSINILAGLMADDFVFSVDDSYEETLAKVGAIVGHEITHGFDTQGYQYDKDGYYQVWWTSADEQAFQFRAHRLANYFSGIIPYPGATGYDGENVQSEAIADMGGVKCMLGIAEDIPDFDYELFFEAYASLWRAKNDYGTEESLAGDVHPLNFLRVNAVLQQFDKFYETYDIQPGDGMYLAPEDRVAVW